MARHKRIDLPHCLYHVMSRTNSGDTAFHNRADRDKFFYYLDKYSRQLSFRILSFCLMPNHFHLLLESGESASLSEFMRRLLTAYTIYFNRLKKRRGHLFQGRFKSIVVDKAEYLISLSRYIHLNPHNESLNVPPESYDGSSLRYYIKGNEPSFLDTSEILAWFKNNRAKYAQYIRKGLNEEIHLPILEQRYLGGAAFVQRLQKRIASHAQKTSRTQMGQSSQNRTPADAESNRAKELEKMVAEHFHLPVGQIKTRKAAKGSLGQARKAMIALLAETLPWTYVRIAQHMGLSNQSNISYHLQRIQKNREMQKHLEEIRKRLHK